jgi:hypothetical protein
VRKTKEITIEDGGARMTFRIRQMPATQLESWLMRAIIQAADAAGSGAELAPGAGLEQIFSGENAETNLVKIVGGLDYDKAKPLLDEMLACCYRVDGQAEIKCTPEIMDGMISDVKSLWTLRKEALTLNLGFIKGGTESGLPSPAKINIGKPQPGSED